MWEEIGNISGLPFHLCSPSNIDIDDELHIAKISSEAVSKELKHKMEELDLAGKNYAATKAIHQEEMEEIRCNLWNATQHAASVEIEIENVKERNNILSATVDSLQEENAAQLGQLATLHDHIKQLSEGKASKEEQLSQARKERDILSSRLIEVEQNLMTRIKDLEEGLREKSSIEDQLRADQVKTKQEFQHLQTQNLEYEAIQKRLENRLNEVISDSKQQQRMAVEAVKADTRSSVMMLEAKLKQTSNQLEAAERGEKEARSLARESKQEAADILENMHKKIANDREKLRAEMSDLHSIEISKYKTELNFASEGNEHLSKELNETNSRMSKQVELFSKKMADAEKRTSEANRKVENSLIELQGKSALCDRLEAELDEFNKAKEMMKAELKSLHSELESAKTKMEKDSQQYWTSIESMQCQIQELKNTIDHERLKHSNTIDKLEDNMTASVGEIFSRLKLGTID